MTTKRKKKHGKKMGITRPRPDGGVNRVHQYFGVPVIAMSFSFFTVNPTIGDSMCPFNKNIIIVPHAIPCLGNVCQSFAWLQLINMLRFDFLFSYFSFLRI